MVLENSIKQEFGVLLICYIWQVLMVSMFRNISNRHWMQQRLIILEKNAKAMITKIVQKHSLSDIYRLCFYQLYLWNICSVSDKMIISLFIKPVQTLVWPCWITAGCGSCAASQYKLFIKDHKVCSFMENFDINVTINVFCYPLAT